MTTEMIFLRVLHIVPGAVWVGSAVFMALVLEPSIRLAGPEAARALGPHLVKRVTPILHASAALTVAFGLVLVARTPGHDYGDLFTNTWGWVIGFGLIVAVAAWVIGAVSGQAIRNVVNIGASLQGPPSPDQAAEIGRLQVRSRWGVRLTAALVVVSVGLMASARWT